MSETIFLTGASGFLGSHIAIQLLEKGYRVRAAARGAKVSELKTVYAEFGEQFEVVSISDIASDQFPDALQGVNAVIHSAAPLPDRAPPELIIKGAVEGTMNVIRQAEKAGITRIVVTSSIATVINPQKSFTDQDWNPITIEEAAAPGAGAMASYRVAKTLAERELWEFVDSHPHLDVTTLNPPVFYGPFAKTFRMPTPNYYALSTNLYLYRLLTPDGTYTPLPFYLDVRDVAKAHIFALTSPLSTEPGVGRKRILIASLPEDVFNPKAILDLIRHERPHLKDRLTKVPPPDGPFISMPYDVSRVERAIGMKREDFTPLKDTMLDAVDSILELEKEWVGNGHTIQVPKA